MEQGLRNRLYAEIGREDYQVKIQSGHHGWLSDEPENAGGKDKGPSPYELLLSSLASCTLITMCMYAERKQWDLEGAEVYLNFTFSDTPEKRITDIQREIKVKGMLDDGQKERLLYIARKCPVAKILEGSIQIDSSILES